MLLDFSFRRCAFVWLNRKKILLLLSSVLVFHLVSCSSLPPITATSESLLAADSNDSPRRRGPLPSPPSETSVANRQDKKSLTQENIIFHQPSGTVFRSVTVTDEPPVDLSVSINVPKDDQKALLVSSRFARGHQHLASSRSFPANRPSGNENPLLKLAP